jgi:Bax protein
MFIRACKNIFNAFKSLTLKIKMYFIVAIAVVLGFLFYLPASDKPVKYTNIDVKAKKARFIQIMLPPTKAIYIKLKRKYLDTKELIAKNPNSKEIQKLKLEYKAKNNTKLLEAIKPHPISIALAQAAMESSWATSRFFNEANNVFGVWSFNKDEPRIAAGKKRGSKTIWLKKYKNVEESIKGYYKLLAVSSAFSSFRALRMKTNSPFELVKKLDNYSEKREVYGKELAGIIRFNKFDSYDID